MFSSEKVKAIVLGAAFLKNIQGKLVPEVNQIA